MTGYYHRVSPTAGKDACASAAGLTDDRKIQKIQIMTKTILLLIAGFVLLIYGADKLVDGASGIAKRFGISNLVIGSTIVALGTSLPEMVVNLLASAQGDTDLAITNIVGSNIINTFVILGLTALVCPIASMAAFRRFDIPMSTVSCLIVLGMLATFGCLNMVCGITLSACFAYYMYRMVRMSKSGEKEVDDIQAMVPWKASLFIMGGIVGLTVGGRLVVDGAVEIANALGIPQAVVGLTVVALGTSLPELVTSVVAAAKKNTDLAIGNVIGSNIFNVFFVLGISSLVHPLPSYDGITLDVVMAVVSSALVLLFTSTDKDRSLKWWHGAILLAVYSGYLTWRLLSI